MHVKAMSNVYNLSLSLGAFYLGISMILGKGAFDTFPQEWLGVLPFTSWASLALFGMIVFGLGNGIAAMYGFFKKDKKIFVMTFMMGILFCSSTVISTILLGEWYLPTSAFLGFSFIQIVLGLLGLLTFYRT